MAVVARRRTATVRLLLLTLGCALAVGFSVLRLTSAPALGQEGTPAPAEVGAEATPATPETGEAAPATEGAAPAPTEGAQPAAEGTPAPFLPLASAGVRPDSACRMCHVDSTAVKVLPSGETVNAGIDLEVLASSVHGLHAQADGVSVYCTDCHNPRQRYQFPHAENPAQTLHDFARDISNSCQSCHLSIELHNPGHVQAIQDGRSPAELPACTDCHGGHDVAPSATLETDTGAFCQSCHLIAEMEQLQVREVHENVMQAFAPAGATGASAAEVSCRTCHNDQPQSVSQSCVNCHGMLQGSVQRGEDTIDLNVNAHDLYSSVHGERVIDGVDYTALQCADCHRDIAEAGFPHPEELLVDRRQLRTNVEAACTDCHEGAAQASADGIHAVRIAEGELNAASCADCHGSHEIQIPNVPRTRVSETCGNCHTEIYDAYRTSVHGAALYGRDNPDVPVCTDCHSAHDIGDPRTAAFRAASPQMCGDCHANKTMMAKYDISTAVFDTYVADFHGTTAVLFAHDNPNEPINTAVCFDCHGVHDIQSVSDATEEQIRVRILETCRACHPDASENFSAAWLSHYEPSLEHYPAIYLVDLFYKVLIPTVLGGFMLFIFSDIFRRLSDRWLRRRAARGGT